MTFLAPITFRPDGKVNNRLSDDAFAVRTCQLLDQKLGSKIPQRYSLLPTLSILVQNGRRFRKALGKPLDATIAPDGPCYGSRNHSVVDITVGITWIPQRPSGNRIVGVISNIQVDSDILLYTKVILAGRISEKEGVRRCYVKQFPNETSAWWLVLIDIYLITDAETYPRAFREVSIQHSFERIWIALHTGGMISLYEAA